MSLTVTVSTRNIVDDNRNTECSLKNKNFAKISSLIVGLNDILLFYLDLNVQDN